MFDEVEKIFVNGFSVIGAVVAFEGLNIEPFEKSIFLLKRFCESIFKLELKEKLAEEGDEED